MGCDRNLVEWSRHRLSEVLAEHCTTADAECIAARFCDDMRSTFGGERCYIARRIGAEERAERDDLIRLEVLVNGKSPGWAAREFDLSRSQVRRICEPR